SLLGQLGYLFNLVFTFPIFNVLVLFYRLFGDFGLSIVVLTIVIKLILFPLTLKQLRSMKSTQALQPQIAEIKKKYAKDQQAQMMATQALYKEYGINPASGCLPLVPQMFVLYGLYQAFDIVLRFTPTKTETLLQHINHFIYPFIPQFATLPNLNLNWFTFISHAFSFPLGQPDPTHILPILAGLATFVQLRMSQPATASSTTQNDPTQQTMKTMQYIMPLFTVFIGWTFPSGLALYWTVSSIFQAIQQYFVTGWGNLLVLPGVAAAASKPSATSQRDFAKERQEGGGPSFKLFGKEFAMPPTPDSGNGNGSSKNVVEGSISPAKSNGNGNGSIEGKLRPVPAASGSRANGNGSNGNSSSAANAARRRASGGSASARRRSNGSSSSQKRSSSRR
ncbi:MAG TPA: hypothetical protein DHW02_15585, partial [Ktedonobacter sp.]|nr:hypothetical protein [Ktedonobacter sp.]